MVAWSDGYRPLEISIVLSRLWVAIISASFTGAHYTDKRAKSQHGISDMGCHSTRRIGQVRISYIKTCFAKANPADTKAPIEREERIPAPDVQACNRLVSVASNRFRWMAYGAMNVSQESVGHSRP